MIVPITIDPTPIISDSLAAVQDEAEDVVPVE